MCSTSYGPSKVNWSANQKMVLLLNKIAAQPNVTLECI